LDAHSFIRQAARVAELLDIVCDAGPERGAEELDRRGRRVLATAAPSCVTTIGGRGWVTYIESLLRMTLECYMPIQAFSVGDSLNRAQVNPDLPSSRAAESCPCVRPLVASLVNVEIDLLSPENRTWSSDLAACGCRQPAIETRSTRVR